MTDLVNTKNFRDDCCQMYRTDLMICSIPAMGVLIAIWSGRYVPISVSIEVLREMWRCNAAVEARYHNCCYQ